MTSAWHKSCAVSADILNEFPLQFVEKLPSVFGNTSSCLVKKIKAVMRDISIVIANLKLMKAISRASLLHPLMNDY